jgi:hypothetical protein
VRRGAPARQGVLRTKETVDRFKSVPPAPGQSSPLLVYFGTLLTRGRLNKFESVELAQLVVAQNKKHLLDNWLREARAAAPPARARAPCAGLPRPRSALGRRAVPHRRAQTCG